MAVTRVELCPEREREREREKKKRGREREKDKDRQTDRQTPMHGFGLLTTELSSLDEIQIE